MWLGHPSPCNPKPWLCDGQLYSWWLTVPGVIPLTRIKEGLLSLKFCVWLKYVWYKIHCHYLLHFCDLQAFGEKIQIAQYHYPKYKAITSNPYSQPPRHTQSISAGTVNHIFLWQDMSLLSQSFSFPVLSYLLDCIQTSVIKSVILNFFSHSERIFCCQKISE